MLVLIHAVLFEHHRRSISKQKLYTLGISGGHIFESHSNKCTILVAICILRPFLLVEESHKVWQSIGRGHFLKRVQLQLWFLCILAVCTCGHQQCNDNKE